MELLAPAGNYRSFLGAVKAGCDAVYLGGRKFGARAYADNFTDEEIISAISYGHSFGVKVYLTVNTLIKEAEFSEAIDYIRPFYEAGLDACIVQDLGLISVFKDEFPKMELHISTQGFATDINSVRLFKKLGASRVVLARELSLEEIKYIKDSEDVELETFIHGAMCYSYSGQCLMSSCIGGRSGNRGRCAGTCRLPYSLNVNGIKQPEAYYLSMKDQCTLEILPRLIEAGIDSLKIEGRMKSPEYTAYVTSMYRKYIDLYNSNPGAYKVDTADLEKLKHIYLRSEIGTGYYDIFNGPSMLTLKNPAYNGNDEKLLADIKAKLLDSPLKKKIRIEAYVTVNEPLMVNMFSGNTCVTISGGFVSESVNRPVSVEDVVKQLSKLGDSPFEAEEVTAYISGNCFVPVKELNELRRKAVTELVSVLSNNTDDSHRSTLPVTGNTKSVKGMLASVKTLEQLEVVDGKCVDALVLIEHKIISGASKILSGKNLYYINFPHVFRKKNNAYYERLYQVASDNGYGIVVHNPSTLEFVLDRGFEGSLICGQELYAFNRKSFDFLHGCFDAVISPFELCFSEYREVGAKMYELAYGRMPIMHTANCVYKSTIGCKPNWGNVFDTLTDRKGAALPVYRDCNVCENIIYNSVPTSLHEEASLGKIKQDNSLFMFTTENGIETGKVLDLFDSAFRGKNIKPFYEYTRGYRKRGVE